MNNEQQDDQNQENNLSQEEEKLSWHRNYVFNIKKVQNRTWLVVFVVAFIVGVASSFFFHGSIKFSIDSFQFSVFITSYQQRL